MMSRGPNIRSLPPERQSERLGSIFKRLANVLAEDRNGLSLVSDPLSLAPERALVLEVSGSIVDFRAIAERVSGLEFLGDEASEFEPDEDFFIVDDRIGRTGERRLDKKMEGRLYLSMPDVRALGELLSLWQKWQHGKELPLGFKQWKHVFGSLRTIRPWGPADRLSEDTISFWREELETSSANFLRIEVELWFRRSTEVRSNAYQRFEAVVAKAGGTIVDHRIISEIGYEAALVDMPATKILRLVESKDVHLAVCDDVMFLRPQTLIEVPVPSDQTEVTGSLLHNEAVDLPPVAALLDGVPVQNHVLLKDRLEVDDPDQLDAISVVADRYHGTAMASLILHGDRNANEKALSRRLHLRPILYAPGQSRSEQPNND